MTHMRIFEQLKRVTHLLQQYPGQWAVCGGVAASIYRTAPRFTNDIDVALVDSQRISAFDLASQVMQALGYQPMRGFIPDIRDGERQILGLIAGREGNDPRFVGIDLLLPVQFWIPKAVELAQRNVIDYGFASLPTITPESLLIAKITAVRSSPSRYQDLDDITDILGSLQIDKGYVVHELCVNNVEIPEALREVLRS